MLSSPMAIETQVPSGRSSHVLWWTVKDFDHDVDIECGYVENIYKKHMCGGFCLNVKRQIGQVWLDEICGYILVDCDNYPGYLPVGRPCESSMSIGKPDDPSI